MNEEKKVVDVKEAHEYIGAIILIAIQVERQIEMILGKYFAKKSKEGEFMEEFLYDEYCDYGLKLKVFLKLGLQEGYYKEFEEDLRRIKSIRNIVAHSFVLLEKKEVYVGRKREYEHLKELLEETLEKYKKVSEVLDQIQKGV